MTMFGYNNTYEKTAEERGYVPISCYDTKEEIDHVISKSMQNVIKREIIKCLAIEAEGETK